jgi:protein-export membrane protein SecD/preprotein translocase SecF subunit
LRQGWLFGLVAVLLLLALSVTLPVGRYIWRDQYPGVNKGLDVAGGFRVILKAKTAGMTEEDWREKRGVLPKILEQRLQGAFHVVEAHVVPKGRDQFIVEIPGVTNSEEVIDLISTTARLEFWHPLNVQTERDTARQYVAAERETEQGTREYDIKDATVGLEAEPVIYKSGSDELYEFMQNEWDLILTGDMLKQAKATQAAQGPVVQLKFDKVGSERLYEFSRKVEGLQEILAIVLDKHIISFPRMQAVITSGDAVIEGGGMTGKDAARLAALLQAGALPVDLERISMQKVEPTIGEQALGMILVAGLVGVCVIALFMMAYYRIPGIMAVLALICYSIFCYAVYRTIHVTFSLAGIAGFILSIGMAVDANVLIFERMKEELRTGKTLLHSIDNGFKRAFTAIFDSNVCTIITCIVLYNLGTGPVQGFAATLGIGVVISLFTAITLTRMLLYRLVQWGVQNPNLFALGLQWFGAGRLQIIRRMWVYFTLSLLVLVPGMVFAFMGGFKPNIEFSPGAEIIYKADKGLKATNAQIQAKLESSGFAGASVQLSELPDSKQIIVRMRELKDYPVLRGLTNLQQRQKIAESLAEFGVDASIVEVTEAQGATATAATRRVVGVESSDLGSRMVLRAEPDLTASPAEIQRALKEKGFDGAVVQKRPAEGSTELVVTLRPLDVYENLAGLSRLQKRQKVAEALEPYGVDASIVEETAEEGAVVGERRVASVVSFENGVSLAFKGAPDLKATPDDVATTLRYAGFEGVSATLEPTHGFTRILLWLRPLESYQPLRGLDDVAQEQKIAASLQNFGVDSTIRNIYDRKVASEYSFAEVGKIISSETLVNATKALLIALALILAYLSFRFAIEGGWSGVKFGSAALVATVHDAGVVIGMAAIFGYFFNWEVSSLFLTALLTIIGFSVHDTIVIFDRIRENLRLKKKGEPFDDMVDRSITQSFARSINTSLTVVIVLAALLFIGSAMPDLRHFHAVMLVGVISGTYSSLYNASPILVLIERFAHRMGGKTLEAAVKERDKRAAAPAPKVQPAVAGSDSTEAAPEEPAAEPTPDGKRRPKTGKPKRARPKSKKPKRRF